MDISNQTVIITGGASGLGAATARYLAEKGAKVAILDANLEQANEVASAISGFALQCDVANEKTVTQVLDQIEQALGPIRICINCAGIAPAKRIAGKHGPMPLEDFKRVIDVNLIGTFNIMRVAASKMSQYDSIDENSSRGVIINTASIAAYDGQLGQVAYAASKGGIVSLTLPAARELGAFGVRVVTIAPGVMGTPMFFEMPEKLQDSLSAQTLHPKRAGKPEEFAKMVSHVIENDLLNATVIRLDGGLRM